MPMGFIQSELDLKLLVLYIMSRVAGPVTFLQLLELALCDEGVDYFSLTEAVGHMVETGQLERDQILVAVHPHGIGQTALADLAVAAALVGDGIVLLLVPLQLARLHHVTHGLGEREVVHALVAQGQLQ